MKILILGGSIFVGRHIVEAALNKGHEVSVFNRGQSDSKKLDDVEYLYGDRHKDISVLENRSWDFVVDASGYTPNAVDSMVNLLKNSIRNYIFISSGSVYKDLSLSHLDENSSLQQLNDQEIAEAERLSSDDSPTVLTYGKHYGGLKAKCEELLLSEIPDKALIIRAGILVGPYDYTNRFLYWLLKCGAGSNFLLPENIVTPLSLIDARDLAKFVIRMGEKRETGIYNVTGMQRGLTFEHYLTNCQSVSGGKSTPIKMNEKFIDEQQIKLWEELPLLVPKQARGLYSIDDNKALAKGLDYRPLAASLSDTLEWLQRHKPAFKIKVGIDPERECELIAAWKSIKN